MVTLHAPSYLTIPQAAEISEVSTSTIRRWIRSGLLSAEKTGTNGRTSPIHVSTESLARLVLARKGARR